MINPNKITNFKRTQEQIQEFLLFCIIVAGKNSDVQAKKLDAFLFGSGCSPFDWIDWIDGKGILEDKLKGVKMGQYNRIAPCFREIAKRFNNGNIYNLTLNDLMSVKGIGPKTARFFLVHSQEGCDHAILDTHVLTWLRQFFGWCPKITPVGQAYLDWEQIFLDKARELWPNKSIAEIDLEIWKQRSKWDNKKESSVKI